MDKENIDKIMRSLDGTLDNDISVKEKEEKELKELLDCEIKKIKDKIKNSKPKWIIENFDEFINKEFCKERKEYIIMTKIWKERDAKKLGVLLEKLRGSNLDNTNAIRIVWKDGYGYWYFKRCLDESKIIELVKAWMFYYNTMIPYKKIKFYDGNPAIGIFSKISSIFDWAVAWAITILIIMMVICILALIISVIYISVFK